jgi:hypothetical protein
VVIALERSYFPAGLDKRGGPRQVSLTDTRLPTPWNQIEAAMAYTKHLPLLVIVEAGLKAEGLLESGYDWYVQTLPLEATALSSNEFNGVLADWKDKVLEMGAPPAGPARPGLQGLNPADMSVLDLLGALRPVQLWSVTIALAGLLAGAFSLGARLVRPPDGKVASAEILGKLHTSGCPTSSASALERPVDHEGRRPPNYDA